MEQINPINKVTLKDNHTMQILVDTTEDLTLEQALFGEKAEFFEEVYSYSQWTAYRLYYTFLQNRFLQNPLRMYQYTKFYYCYNQHIHP